MPRREDSNLQSNPRDLKTDFDQRKFCRLLRDEGPLHQVRHLVRTRTTTGFEHSVEVGLIPWEQIVPAVCIADIYDFCEQVRFGNIYASFGTAARLAERLMNLTSCVAEARNMLITVCELPTPTRLAVRKLTTPTADKVLRELASSIAVWHSNHSTCNTRSFAVLSPSPDSLRNAYASQPNGLMFEKFSSVAVKGIRRLFATSPVTLLATVNSQTVYRLLMELCPDEGDESYDNADYEIDTIPVIHYRVFPHLLNILRTFVQRDESLGCPLINNNVELTIEVGMLICRWAQLVRRTPRGSKCYLYVNI